jgi:stage II sporulation protein AA (anti-sigma F factor antagonist)
MEHKYEKKYEIRGKTLRYLMPKELDHHVAQSLCRELDMLIESFGVRELELDFAGTEFMDSSGIGLILGRYRLMQDLRGRLTLSALPDHIAKVVALAGIDRLLAEQQSAKKEDKRYV